MNYQRVFDNWFKNHFSQSQYRIDMENTVEDSPYHRENNVWIHTQMVLNEYINSIDCSWSKSDFLGAIAIAFHDAGKPMSEETKENENGEEYRSYNNHEVMSGGIWMNYNLDTNESDLDFYLDDQDIYNIWVLIVYHMVYKFNKDRMRLIKTHMVKYNLFDTFCRLLSSDCYGRISDNEEKRNRKHRKFLQKFKEISVLELRKESECKRTVVILCGCSGIGKSTYSKNNYEHFAYHSMDQLRLDWYDGDDYTNAFHMSNEDKDFSRKVQQDFSEKLKKHKQVLVDNTCLSFKRRRPYISMKETYRIAVVFLSSYETISKQNRERKDKTIHQKTINRMYYNFYPALYGEFDLVKLVFRN